MLALIIIILILGIIWGFLLFAILFLHLIKVKCPKCKQLRKVKEIVLFQWKTKTISGQPCLKCRIIKPQLEIF